MLWIPARAQPADEDVAYDNAPLRAVLIDVQARTGVRFLYRDALVAGIRVSLRAPAGAVLDSLRAALPPHGLALQVDPARQQAILTRAEAPRADAVLRGTVLDATTGTRLPRATLTWDDGGTRRGVATDDSGTFQIPRRRMPAKRSTLRLTASYVGYQSQTVRVDLHDLPSDLAVRLKPAPTPSPEVVVRTSALQSDLDTTWQTLIRPEREAALGEASVLRALQPLPSVSLTPALVDGLSVRGSRADGFHVLLDGISVYNQSHLFGLFDAFNAEALQTVGFFYGVAPADYPAPPGGTLAFRTRTGSQSGVRLTGEASPTAVSATAEGPIEQGQGSWLVSARHSTLGLGGVGNDALIAQGLGVDRRTEPLPPGTRRFDELLFDPGPPSARFADVHAKGLWETPAGGRWTLSAYVGSDAAEQGGQRLERDASPTLRERLRRDGIDTTTVETEDRWGSLGASLQWQRPLGERAFSDVTTAVSRYYSRYATDDFLYAQADPRTEVRFFYDTFAHENELTEWSLTHRIGIAPPHPGRWTLGYAASLYDVAYEEATSVAAPFRGTQRSVQAAVFGQYDVTAGPMDVRLGLRGHYFSQGDYGRLSPRVQLRWTPRAPLSVGAGYSRNHQFLHRLHLVGDVSSAVWVPSTEAQPPGEVDHWMASMSVRPTSRTALQVEAYWKAHRNLRQHATTARLDSQGQTVLFDPWTVRNTSTARGVEVLARQTLGPVTWTGAYTLSRVDLDPVGPRSAEPADWDRRHQVTTRLVWTPTPRTSVHATWAWATGVPNPYAQLPRAETDRLDAYHRLDVGASLGGTAGAVRWTLRASVFNAYDRDNPWHRMPVGVLRPDGDDPDRFPETGFTLLDVYDLGVRPSVSVSVTW